MASDASSSYSWAGSNDSILDASVKHHTEAYDSLSNQGSSDLGDVADLGVFSVFVSMLSGYVFQVHVFPLMIGFQLYDAVQLHFNLTPVWYRMEYANWNLVTATSWTLRNNDSEVDWLPAGSMLTIVFG